MPLQLPINIIFSKSQTKHQNLFYGRLDSGIATYTNNVGKITQAVEFNPRYDYDPFSLECLGVLIEPERTNILINSNVSGTTLPTQTVSVINSQYTLSFYGTGTIVLSGSHSATVIGTGIYPNRRVYSFTPMNGNLTITVVGSVQYAQLELGAFETSFIHTEGSQATRLADLLYLSLSGIYSISGSFIVSGDFKQTINSTIFKAIGSTGNFIEAKLSSNQINTNITSSSIERYSNNFQVNSKFKICLSYDTTNTYSAMNGQISSSVNTANIPSGLTTLYVGSDNGSNVICGHISQIAYTDVKIPEYESRLNSFTTFINTPKQPNLLVDFERIPQLNSHFRYYRNDNVATRVNTLGSLESVPIDFPRFTFNNGVCVGLLLEEPKTNILVNSLINGSNLQTQTITVTNQPRTLSFSGTGTVVMSGAHTATVVGSGNFPTRKVYQYTPSAGNITLTVTGTVNFAQDELGNVTSFIPTDATPKTRSQNSLSISNIEFSSWYYPEAGTFAIEFVINSNSEGNTIFHLGNDASNYVKLKYNPVTSKTEFIVVNGGVTVLSTTSNAINFGDIIAQTFSYSKTSVMAMSNNTSLFTGNSFLSVTPNILSIGSSTLNSEHANCTIKKLTYYPYDFKHEQKYLINN